MMSNLLAIWNEFTGFNGENRFYLITIPGSFPNRFYLIIIPLIIPRVFMEIEGAN